MKKICLVAIAVALNFALTACVSLGSLVSSGTSTPSAAAPVSRNGNGPGKFVFTNIPKNVDELMALPESDLRSPHRTAALALLVMMNYEQDTEACHAMIDVLRGPDPLSNYDKSFMKDRLKGKQYKIGSYFAGATVENGYKPTQPYTIEITENSYSFTEENSATLYVKSAGADTPRPVGLRKKPSTGQWFLTGFSGCLADIRTPAALDPWY